MPLFLSIALGLSAIETGVRILPLSITLIIAAVGIPKVFPQASPRRVCQFGFLALFLGLVVFVAALDAGAGAEIVTWPMLLAGAGIGALASQLGAVTVSALPDEQSGEVGGLQNTFSNLGLSLGTALAGAVLIVGAHRVVLRRHPEQPRRPERPLVQGADRAHERRAVHLRRRSRTGARRRGRLPEDHRRGRRRERRARLDGLRASLSVLAVLALVALFLSGSIPTTPVGAEPAEERSRHLVPACAGAALAFVHGLHARDGDGAALLDERVTQALRRGHQRRPRRRRRRAAATPCAR